MGIGRQACRHSIPSALRLLQYLFDISPDTFCCVPFRSHEVQVTTTRLLKHALATNNIPHFGMIKKGIARLLKCCHLYGIFMFSLYVGLFIAISLWSVALYFGARMFALVLAPQKCMGSLQLTWSLSMDRS